MALQAGDVIVHCALMFVKFWPCRRMKIQILCTAPSHSGRTGVAWPQVLTATLKRAMAKVAAAAAALTVTACAAFIRTVCVTAGHHLSCCEVCRRIPALNMCDMDQQSQFMLAVCR